MTALERKQNSENQLSSLGIHLTDNLPPLEEESKISLKPAQEIAERILILTYLNCIHSDNSLREDIVTFLKAEGLFDKATAAEKDLFLKDEFTDEDATIVAWRGESIWMLLWAINLVDTLTLPTSQADLNEVFKRLPPFLQSTSQFINPATIRSKEEIMNQADLIFRLFWYIQHAQSPHEMSFDIGVTFERYYSITWVCGMRKEWEESDQ